MTELAAGGPAAAGLEGHLAACGECREELDALRLGLEAVDADLGALAAVEPSPELAVRIRLATAETSAIGGFPAFALQALAAGAVLAALVFVLRGHEPATTPIATLTPRPPRVGGPPSPAPPTAQAQEGPPAPLSVRPVEAMSHPSASSRPAVPPEAQVLVPPGQLEALQRFASLVNRERVASPSLAAVEQGSPDLAAPRPIDVRWVEITPLEIVPLDPAEDTGTQAEGERR